MQNTALVTALRRFAREDQILLDEPMCRHTTFRIGGPADVMFLPESAEEILLALDAAGKAGVSALVIGNEGSGISGAFRDAADQRVKIPMEGNIESLNAAAAAAVLMYEAVRQRHAAGKAE